LKPSWITKTDPEKYPVRFLASIWQQQMKANFGGFVNLTPKEKGQLKALRLHLGDLTQPVIEWVVDPVNWWHFCQQVLAESKNHLVTEHPDIGLLLLCRGSALRVMRSKLSDCIAGADFVKKLDRREYEQLKALALVYAEGKPERLAKIEAATTLIEIKTLFNEMMDESVAESTNEIHVLKDSA
jgi:hypothetical protein